MRFSQSVTHKSSLAEDRFQALQKKYETLNIKVRGKGLIFGLEFSVEWACLQDCGEKHLIWV